METFRALDVTADTRLAGIEGRYLPTERFEHGAMSYRQDAEAGDGHTLVWDMAMAPGAGEPLGGVVFWGNVSCHWQLRTDSGEVAAQLGPNCRRLTPQQLSLNQKRKRPRWKAKRKARKSKGKAAGGGTVSDMVTERSIAVTPEGDSIGSYWLLPQTAVLGCHAVVAVVLWLLAQQRSLAVAADRAAVQDK